MTLLSFVPPRLKNSIKVLLGRATVVPGRRTPRTGLACPVCGGSDIEFEPLPPFYFSELDRHQFVHSIFQFETLNFEAYSCNRCGAADRDRLYALYFRSALEHDPALSLSVLDIAPAPALTEFLRRFPQVRVRTADLFMPGVDDRVDVTDMSQYRDGEFDVFVCSHVLEHIPDDAKAIRELYRVLKPGGWGIAMVPIYLGSDDAIEDASIVDEAGRWKYFGQYDHVRIYSKKAFVERLGAAGFQVDQFGISHFGKETFRQCGIHPRSVLYVVRKPASPLP